MSKFIQSILVLFVLTLSSAYAGPASVAGDWPWYNPWFFDLGCETFKLNRDENDKVDLYRFNRQTNQFEWFQHLSDYAQKIDYFMEDVDKHYVSVTDESGHGVIYKWRNGKFYVWG